MNNMILKTLAVLILCGTLNTNRAFAHDQVPGLAQQGPIVIRGATIHVGDGTVLTAASLLFDAGKLTALGESLDSPAGATIIDGADKHIYPGLIETWTDIGLREISAVDVTVDYQEYGDFNPNVRTWVAVNPDSELIPVARSGGVLMAHVIPGGSMLQGQSAVIRLDGWDTHDMVIKPAAALCVDWERMIPRGDNAADIAKKQTQRINELDELLQSAARYGEARSKLAEKIGQAVPASDVRLESLLPVLSGERPMFVQANGMAAIMSAIEFMVSHKIKMVLCGGYDAVQCGDLLKKHDIPVVIGGVYRLPQQRHDAYDAAYTLPASLHEIGIRFAIAGEGPGYPGGASNARNLPYHAGMAVAFGLPREAAVSAITSSAADIIGVGTNYGSLEIGKSATLIIADGDILESTTHVTDAYIDGSKVDLNNKHRQLYEKYQQKYGDADPAVAENS